MNHNSGASATPLLHAKAAVTNSSTWRTMPCRIHQSFLGVFSVPIPEARSTKLTSYTNTCRISTRRFEIVGFLSALMTRCAILGVVILVSYSLCYQDQIFLGDLYHWFRLSLWRSTLTFRGGIARILAV